MSHNVIWKKIANAAIDNLIMIAVLAIAALIPASCDSAGNSTQHKEILTEDDLDGMRLGVLQGTSQEFALLDKFGPDRLMSFNTEPDAIEAVRVGKVGAFYMNRLATIGIMMNQTGLDTIPTSFPEVDVGACFNLDSTGLAGQFQCFMDTFKLSDESADMYYRWHNLQGNEAHRHIEMPTSGDPIRVGVLGSTPQFSFYLNGELDGYEIELARRFARAIGRPLEFDIMNFGALIPSIVSGKSDIVFACMLITPERKKSVILVPYLKSTTLALVKRSTEQTAPTASGMSLPAAALIMLLAAATAAALLRLYSKRRQKAAHTYSADTGNTVIKVSHLKKSYGNLTVLKDINAEIRKGDVISVIGPSGTGKSTLLRCLNLLEQPTEGTIFVNGNDILAPDADVPALRRKIGMVFQSFNLFSGFSVIENITFAPQKLLGLSRDEANREALRLLRMVGLAEKANAFPDQLSGGQKQRIAIARSLAMRPDIILFDEPTSALDTTMVSSVSLSNTWIFVGSNASLTVSP